MKTVKLLIPTFLVFCSIYCLAQGKEGVLSTEGISPSVSKRSRLAGVKHEERYPGPDYIIYANGDTSFVDSVWRKRKRVMVRLGGEEKKLRPWKDVRTYKKNDMMYDIGTYSDLGSLGLPRGITLVRIVDAALCSYEADFLVQIGSDMSRTDEYSNYMEVTYPFLRKRGKKRFLMLSWFWKNRLRKLMKDCPEALKAVKETRYSEFDKLNELLRIYNDCMK